VGIRFWTGQSNALIHFWLAFSARFWRHPRRSFWLQLQFNRLASIPTFSPGSTTSSSTSDFARPPNLSLLDKQPPSTNGCPPRHAVDKRPPSSTNDSRGQIVSVLANSFSAGPANCSQVENGLHMVPYHRTLLSIEVRRVGSGQ
jgi:hypothetical protein